jgi:hypothetical protein
MILKKGDRLIHKELDREATLVEDLGNGILEVEQDDVIFFWHKIKVEKKKPLFNIEYNSLWDRNEQEKVDDICICTGRELLNFGCICGYVEKYGAGDKQRED